MGGGGGVCSLPFWLSDFARAALRRDAVPLRPPPLLARPALKNGLVGICANHAGIPTVKG